MSNNESRFVSNSRLLTRKQTLNLVETLNAEKDQSGSITVCVKSGTDDALLRGALQPVAGELELPELSRTVSSSATGAVFFWTPNMKCVLIPPFPIKANVVSMGIETLPMKELLVNDLVLGLVIIRLGEYAIGVFKGERRLTSKVGTGLVHARHRQGGSSAHRFERHREKQMEAFFLRICAHVREQFESEGESIDHLCFGGERFTIQAFRARCKFLSQYDDRVLDKLLDIRRPRQEALDLAIIDVWSTRMVSWIQRGI